MKVLIIEDDILIQKSLVKLIEKKGCEVLATASGHKAIKLIADNNFDKIVCDLMLQDLTGFDIIEESKKIYSLDEISKNFVIITAYSSESVIQKAKEYGCKLLNKPFEDIHLAISTILQK